MPDFDLDSFKKTWQEQEVTPKYEQSEILEMLNKKSRNNVKYILWISLLEFTIFLAISLYYFVVGNQEDSLINVLNNLGVNGTPELHAQYEQLYFVMKLVTLLVTGFFVLRFYRKYHQINIEESLKILIQKIIAFKKTVKAFIFINIVLLIVYILILCFFVFNTLYMQNITLNNTTLIGFCIGIVITVLLSIILVWAYYKLVYGIIIKRLDKYLSQLQEIEQGQ